MGKLGAASIWLGEQALCAEFFSFWGKLTFSLTPRMCQMLYMKCTKYLARSLSFKKSKTTKMLLEGEKCIKCSNALNISLQPYFGRCLYINPGFVRNSKRACDVCKLTCFAWIAELSRPHSPTPSAFVSNLMERVMFSRHQSRFPRETESTGCVSKERDLFWGIGSCYCGDAKVLNLQGRLAGWKFQQELMA